MEQVPAARMNAVMPVTEQTVGVVEARVGISPELVQTWSAIGAAPTATLFRGEKVMVWLLRAGGGDTGAAGVTVKIWVTGAAAA
jgi:hypothetical protein